MSLGKTEVLYVLIFLFLLYQSVLSKWPWGFKFTLVHKVPPLNIVSLGVKKIYLKEIFFLKRTELTYYLELLKLSWLADNLKQTYKYVGNYLEPLRFQCRPDSFPGAFYLFFCRILAGPTHLSLDTVIRSRTTFIHCCKPQISKWKIGVEFMRNLQVPHFITSALSQQASNDFPASSFSPIYFLL